MVKHAGVVLLQYNLEFKSYNPQPTMIKSNTTNNNSH